MFSVSSSTNNFLTPFTITPVEIYPHKVDTAAAELCVIIIAFNHGSYIAKCIESVLAQQTDFSFYIYLAEDQSSDETRAICLEYAKRFPKKIILSLNSRENNLALNGRPSARHNIFHALLDVHSKYIAIFEGDDYWTDTLKIQRQYNWLESHPKCNLVYTDAEIINISDNPLNRSAYHSATAYDFGFNESLQQKNGPALTLMYRSNALDLQQYFQLIHDCAAGDWPMELLLNLTGKGHRMNVSTSAYLRRNEGSTLRYLVKPFVYANGRISVLKNLLETDVLDQSQRNSVAAFLRRLYWLRAAEHFYHGNYASWLSDLKNFFYDTIKSTRSKSSVVVSGSSALLFKIEWIPKFYWRNILKQSGKYYLVGTRNRFKR